MQPLEPSAPRRIGPYRLLGRLDAGGMGRVYLGRSVGGRTVAIKVVHPHIAFDGEFRERFRREVDSLRRVGGRWTTPVLDADPGAEAPWVATEYVAAPSVSRAVSDHGPLPARSVRGLGAGLAEALGVVHALGLVHRDVKPANVLLTLDGPLLIDFGIVRALETATSSLSTAGPIGTPGYISPEAVSGGTVTGASDVFALGAVLAYAATGRSPFPGTSAHALLYQVVHDEPLLGPMDPVVSDIVAACLAKDPADRPSPAEILDSLTPDGTTAPVGTGWLPPAVVEEVSRAAVALLNLEPQEIPKPHTPEQVTGPRTEPDDPPARTPTRTRTPSPAKRHPYRLLLPLLLALICTWAADQFLPYYFRDEPANKPNRPNTRSSDFNGTWQGMTAFHQDVENSRPGALEADISMTAEPGASMGAWYARDPADGRILCDGDLRFQSLDGRRATADSATNDNAACAAVLETDTPGPPSPLESLTVTLDLVDDELHLRFLRNGKSATAEVAVLNRKNRNN